MTILRNEPNYNLADCESFKSEVRVTRNTSNNGNKKNVRIIVP